MRPDTNLPKDWSTAALGDISEVLLSGVDKKTVPGEQPVRLCNYTDVYYNDYIDGTINFMVATASAREIKKFRIRCDDVLITKDSETADDIAVPALVVDDCADVLCGYHLAILRPRVGEVSGEFLSKLLGLHRIRHYFFTLANGVTRYGLTSDAIKKAVLPLPPLPEQERLASILSTWDAAITQTANLISAKTRLKKALMQQLLTGKRRFPGFSGDWQTIRLGDFLHPIPRKVPRPDKPYRRLGLRSHGKGTFLTIVENPNKVMMDTLYLVKANDLIVNITFAWEGAISLVSNSDEDALVSHRFPTYLFDRSKVISEYFRHVILTKRFVYDLGLVSPGGAGRNRVLSKTDFLKIQVLVPSVGEQEKIAAMLNACDLQIQLLEQRLKALKIQKKGLMQKLLTGKMRVKV